VEQEQDQDQRARTTSVSKPQEIQAITFDVGGTLIEPWPSVGHVYAEVAAAHGVGGLDPESLNRQFAAVWRAKEGFDYSRSGWADIVAKTFHGSGQSEIKFFEALYERFAHREAWRIFDDVLPALESLSEQGIRLAVISNWDERLRPLLGELRLDRYFEFLAISSEIGFHKPSPVIFHEVIRKLSLAPQAVLHVGDSPMEDFQGSIQAGLHAALLNRKRSSTASPPESELTSLTHLAAMLQ